ncbi:UNVERIFIED_CONTAM: hypothetical protein Slati_0457100 [Sesamum latifolium]|uniref:Reverse transcriptase n=1 Tax=Sesamum latifolium TaxID=2727402 RepID=A0AAW2XW12_9LAMI
MGVSGASHPTCVPFVRIEEALESIPGIVKKLMKEFEDVMPNELPRKLPPKRAVGSRNRVAVWHETSHEGTVSQPELVKLRKQLKDMLDSGIIKPAKSPYRASVMFQKKADSSLPA